MEAAEQIRKFQNFFEESYKVDILESIRKGKAFVIADFAELSKFSPELAEDIIETPEETIKAAEIAVEHFDLPENLKNFKVRFKNLPSTQKMMIRNIRSSHINKLIFIDGVVRQKSDVRPQVTAARFECPSCGNVIAVLQLDSKFKEPSRCSCGRKGKFRLLSKELVDAQGLVLEEAPEDLEGGEQPKRVNIFLKNDLVSPLADRKTNPGTKIRVNGIVKEVPIVLREGGQSTRFDLMIDSNCIESVVEDFSEISIDDEELKDILELSKDPKVYTKIINSIAPAIYGHEKVKEALLLQLMGGIRKQRDDGVVTRGDMHVLLIGDPGGGKCLHKDSRIVLSDGSILSIEEFVELNKNMAVDDTGYSIEPVGLYSFDSTARISKDKSNVVWKRKSPEKLLKITTQTGNELIVTKNHPLFITKDALIYSEAAENLKEGDFVASPRRIKTKCSLQPLNYDYEKARARNKVSIKIPKLLDEDVARFLGYIIGDGWISFTKTSGCISFTNNDVFLLNDFKTISEKLFAVNVQERYSRKGKACKENSIYSVELIRFLKEVEPSLLKRSAGKKIPQIINRSSDYVVKEFIKALFDCEAHVRKDKREIELSSKSELLVRDLKILLLRFGIISSIRSTIKYASNTRNKIRQTYYRIKISGKDFGRYVSEIGFGIKGKQEEAESTALSVDKPNTNIDVIPNINKILFILRHRYGLSQFDFPIPRSSYQHYERGDRNPSREALKAIISSLKNYFVGKDYFVEALKQLESSDIFWDKIISVEKIDSGSDYVYDLQIQKNHNYVSNAVIVHNSQLLKRITNVAPKARYVGGKGVSGAGLTASVVRDEFLRGWALEAGALVLANKGICMIDEMDKMSDDDRDAMHEALEQQTVSISKANIQATLRAETTVLAAANPKLGRFDPYEPVTKQIDMPPTLINRFDLIFPIRDIPNKDRDDQMARFILNLHQNMNSLDPDISTKLLRKYIAYAKQNVFPKLTDVAVEEIRNYYVKMRSSESTEETMRTVPITPRQLEALVRLAEASARVRLSDKVTKKDSRRAVELLGFCLEQVGMDHETGKIDIDRISTGITSSERSKIIAVKEVIADLEQQLGKTIPIDDILRTATERNIKTEDVEESIERLKKSGDLFEPRRGFVSRV